MSINCSEKCIYENEGICTLNQIIISSGNISSGCPYFKDKQRPHSEDAVRSYL